MPNMQRRWADEPLWDYGAVSDLQTKRTYEMEKHSIASTSWSYIVEGDGATIVYGYQIGQQNGALRLPIA